LALASQCVSPAAGVSQPRPTPQPPTPPLHPQRPGQVLTVIKGLAAEGVTIVATIHSPTSYAFSLFDT
jgi:ABC-type histidine transport system ATPase subunit